jgi:hypothetical protein
MIDIPVCVYYNKIYYLEFSAAYSGFQKRRGSIGKGNSFNTEGA